MNRNYRNAARSRGFTLMEMIVVLVIIGLIAGLVGPSLFRRADMAKVQTAETQVRMLRDAVHTLRLDLGRVPTSQEGLAMLVRRPAGDDVARYWSGPYLNSDVPLDPWNNPYVYSTESSDFESFSLYSLGADGRPGGEEYDSDVGILPAR